MVASRVYDELCVEYGRAPTDEEVRFRLEQKLGRDRVLPSAGDATSRTAAAAGSPAPPGEAPEEEPHSKPRSRTTRKGKPISPTVAPTHEKEEEEERMRMGGIVRRLLPALNLFALAGILLAALLALAGCGGGEQSSQEEQGSQEETTTAAAPETTGGGSTTTPAQEPTGGSTTGAQGGGGTAEAVAATEAFLATLDDTQRQQVSYDFSDQEAKANWSNFPPEDVPRNGIPLTDMTDEQRQAAFAVLQAALSEEGYRQTIGTMVGDQVINAETQDGSRGGPDQYGSGLYYLAVFGTPSETEPFMLQYGGHHLGLNLTVDGENNILTPSFTGVEPAAYTLDEAVNLPAYIPADVLGTGTIRPMADENDLAFELINALDPEQQDQATLDYDVSALVLGPGEDGRVLEPEGLPVSEMTPEQRALLLDVIREWVGIANDEAAEARMAELEANLDESYFAWYGPTTNGEPVYYRITGPTLHIEFNHEFEDALHIHSVYRDPTNDYGEQTVAG